MGRKLLVPKRKGKSSFAPSSVHFCVCRKGEAGFAMHYTYTVACKTFSAHTKVLLRLAVHNRNSPAAQARSKTFPTLCHAKMSVAKLAASGKLL